MKDKVHKPVPVKGNPVASPDYTGKDSGDGGFQAARHAKGMGLSGKNAYKHSQGTTKGDGDDFGSNNHARNKKRQDGMTTDDNVQAGDHLHRADGRVNVDYEKQTKAPGMAGSYDQGL